jgi:hypothetical protein
VKDAPFPTVEATADVARIKASAAFWEEMTHPSDPIDQYPLSISWRIENIALFAALHGIVHHLPSSTKIHARLLVIPEGKGEALQQPQLAATFDYDEPFDAQNVKDDGWLDESALQKIPNATVTPWIRDAVKSETTVEVLSPEDIILDKDSLAGKHVAATGFTACSGSLSLCLLFTDPLNFTKNIFYDASALPREDRGRLLSCTVMTRCRIILQGLLVNEPLKTISASGISWEDNDSSSSASSRKEADASQPMNVKDFLLDSSSLENRTVVVFGKAQCSGNSCALTQAETTSVQVAPFDGDALPRSDRKRLLDCNQPFSSGCNVHVTGRANAMSGIVASAITWD